MLSAPYLQTIPDATQVSMILNLNFTYTWFTISTLHLTDLHFELDYLARTDFPVLSNQEELEQYSLRNRGLCLVPMENTVGVAQSNGADIWAPVKTPLSPAFSVTSQSPFR